MVICLERGADLHMAQLMPLPLTVSCFYKIQIAFTFLVPAHPDRPGQREIKQGCQREPNDPAPLRTAATFLTVGETFKQQGKQRRIYCTVLKHRQQLLCSLHRFTIQNLNHQLQQRFHFLCFPGNSTDNQTDKTEEILKYMQMHT